MNDPAIDVLFICVPNYLIKDYVIEALESGKHVFCEKPPGINAGQVREMMEAEKRHPELKLMFGFNHRHHESMIMSKQIIDSGKFGKLLWMRGRYGKSVNADFMKNWRANRKTAGGGILLDQGIHMLDLFLMMAGDFEEVEAYVSDLFWKLDVEDNVFAIFRNKNGQVASLHSTMTQWRHLFSLELFLEKGYIVINGLLTRSGAYGEEAMSIAENRTIAPMATWSKEEEMVFRVNTSWKTEVGMFLDSIKNNKKIPVGNTQDALKLMNLIDKIYAKGKKL